MIPLPWATTVALGETSISRELLPGDSTPPLKPKVYFYNRIVAFGKLTISFRAILYYVVFPTI